MDGRRWGIADRRLAGRTGLGPSRRHCGEAAVRPTETRQTQQKSVALFALPSLRQGALC